MSGRIAVEDIRPVVEGSLHSVKAVTGERLRVTATVYREGHDAVGAEVLLLPRGRGSAGPIRMVPESPGTDRWVAEVVPDATGSWTFVVRAFADPYLTWRERVVKRLAAGQVAELANDALEGGALLARALAGVPAGREAEVRRAIAALLRPELPPDERFGPALRLAELLWEHPVRELAVTSAPIPVWVDRPLAMFSSWYEFFPRSESGVDPGADRPVHGTFATAAERLPAIAAMGFDIVYLPPIHPIGRVNRKGRDNTLVAGPDDVGSPWAIGSADGGHDAVAPELGTLADFRAFVARARELGLEVALDLAFQCAPDHPWVAAHPEWFTTRADGSIAYAENPPKKYQDIYPLNFDNDVDGLRKELLRVVLHWVDQGVRVFRVDNPHTKPLSLWNWLLWRVKEDEPDVLFLAEAFTRPAMTHGLARAGFTQSYTYFTWRNTAAELREYCTELVAAADYMRPSFWPATPDILPEALQVNGPAMFRIRALLAALLVPSWGLYSGYELAENAARPGTEEYLHSEKYELRPRRWDVPGSLAGFVTALNAVRRANPAFRSLRNLRFHRVDNEALLVWSKRDAATGNTVIVVCSLDPDRVQWGNVELDTAALGLAPAAMFDVRDEFTGAQFRWGSTNAVRLDPAMGPAHVLVVRS